MQKALKNSPFVSSSVTCSPPEKISLSVSPVSGSARRPAAAARMQHQAVWSVLPGEEVLLCWLRLQGCFGARCLISEDSHLRFLPITSFDLAVHPCAGKDTMERHEDYAQTLSDLIMTPIASAQSPSCVCTKLRTARLCKRTTRSNCFKITSSSRGVSPQQVQLCSKTRTLAENKSAIWCTTVTTQHFDMFTQFFF